VKRIKILLGKKEGRYFIILQNRLGLSESTVSF
jgi:hypothetical protein